jgi:bifunctional DNA-binding transcriptional regulator/antitoxin component of YhaV-PrlF toxin-antitoxin module
VTIPKGICETAGLKAGISLEVIIYDNRIELVPIKPMKELRGSLKELIQISYERMIGYKCH